MANKLGDGYDPQRRYMQKQEAKAKLNQIDYINQVGSPEKERYAMKQEMAGQQEAERN